MLARFFWVLLALFSPIANSADQQAAESTEAVKMSAAERLAPTVNLKVQPIKFGILDDFQLVAKVTNETSKPISIRTGTICFEPDFIRARGIGGGSTCVEIRCSDPATTQATGKRDVAPDCNSRNIQVAEGQSVHLRHYDRVHWASIFDPDRWVALLGWTQRPVGMLVEVEYSGSDARKLKLTRETSIEVSASLVLLLIGAIVGAALLGSFSFAGKKNDGAPTREAAKSSFRLFFSGSCTGVIFILLIQRVGDLDLPFKFAVNDVIGGLIVGLLSFRLSDILHGYFFKKSTHPSTPHG